MEPTFWTHTIWFILLGISTLIEIIVIFTKAENRNLVIALFLSISGLTLAYEIMVWTWMTVAALIFLFWAVKKIYRYSMSHRTSGVYRHIDVLSGLIALYFNTVFAVRLTGVFEHSPYIVPDAYSSMSLITTLEWALLSGMIIFSTYLYVFLLDKLYEHTGNKSY